MRIQSIQAPHCNLSCACAGIAILTKGPLRGPGNPGRECARYGGCAKKGRRWLLADGFASLTLRYAHEARPRSPAPVDVRRVNAIASCAKPVSGMSMRTVASPENAPPADHVEPDPARDGASHRATSSEAGHRLVAAATAIICASAFIGVFGLFLNHEPGRVTAGAIVLDRGSPIYPFTIQNLMWIIFFVGLGETVVRFLTGTKELRQLVLELLPEDPRTMLRAQDLPAIYGRVRGRHDAEQPFLQRLIARVVLQFQAGRSVEQANSLLNSSKLAADTPAVRRCERPAPPRRLPGRRPRASCTDVGRRRPRTPGQPTPGWPGGAKSIDR